MAEVKPDTFNVPVNQPHPPGPTVQVRSQAPSNVIQTITQPAASHLPPMVAPQPRPVYLPPVLRCQQHIKLLAILELVGSCLSLLLGIVVTVVSVSGNVFTNYTGVAIWSGVVGIVASGFGIGAVKVRLGFLHIVKRTDCYPRSTSNLPCMNES